jgi:predicted nicotinamide N-methyase
MSSSTTTTTNKDNGTRPLPLSELKRWMSEDVFLWIREGDEKQLKLDKELEEHAYMNASNLFGETESDSEEEENRRRRVQHWSSSTTSPDGVGGFQQRKSSSSSVVKTEVRGSGDGHGDVNIVFILSDSYEGFGDILWSSARYVANTISNPITCRELLSPLLLSLRDDDNDLDNLSSQQHPLQGTSFLEVGAGAGVPSWAAMKCGANVVCTDLKDTNRIRSMAECAERNFRQIGDDNHILLANAIKTRVCPHDWGSPIDDVVKALNNDSGCNENDNDNDNDKQQRLFDVIIAADCCYMPWWHSELLDSIHKLLSDRGVAIISFALHGNTDDDDVWKLVDRAKYRGFVVEVLESQQLSPPSAAMESKQGLVHTVRLTKPTTT